MLHTARKTQPWNTPTMTKTSPSKKCEIKSWNETRTNQHQNCRNCWEISPMFPGKKTSKRHVSSSVTPHVCVWWSPLFMINQPSVRGSLLKIHTPQFVWLKNTLIYNHKAWGIFVVATYPWRDVNNKHAASLSLYQGDMDLYSHIWSPVINLIFWCSPSWICLRMGYIPKLAC